jgi:hypothetical protein
MSDPPYPALASINKVWPGLFQNASGGRRLVNYFRGAGAARVQGGAVIQMEHEGSLIRRIYRLSGEATGPLAVKRGVLDDAEARAMVDGLSALENDPTAVVTKFPDMWVIATR